MRPNRDIAAQLDRVADLLEMRQARSFRVRAYRRGAEALRQLDRSVREIWNEGGHRALVALPDIGERLASVIEDQLANGHFRLLDHLEASSSPEQIIGSVPGIGAKLAQRIHHDLHIDTLEELEEAAHDGRLEQVRGFGPRRAEMVRGVLESMLRQSTRRRARVVQPYTPEDEHRPGVGVLLAIDIQYRARADADELVRITPRRFNPKKEQWLPIFHAHEKGWDFDAMFSNTARAHRLEKTNDWVVIFYSRAGDEGQCTVVTEHVGELRGRRVVRGREAECRRYYASIASVIDAA